MFLTLSDKLIMSFDNALQTLSGTVRGTGRKNPSLKVKETVTEELSDEQLKQAQAQMRINHTGEVCAQALYHAQMLFNQDKVIDKWLIKAAKEEQDHLIWTAERLDEMKSKQSYLNPFFYGSSFVIGAFLSALSPAVNLGFIRATEDLVCEHLERQTKYLSFDKRSQSIIQTMIKDEQEHSDSAAHYGGLSYSPMALEVMRLQASVMKVSVTLI